MNLRKKLLGFFILAILPSFVLAQETTNRLEPVDCFDEGLYRFQSVQVSTGPEKEIYKAGESVNFTGEIINENSYPVVEGNVYARIAKINDGENFESIGHDVIDEFIAVSDIDIAANDRKAANFSWKIPSSLGSGKYIVTYFFSVDKRFNLGGLPFSNEIVVGIVNFEIQDSYETVFKLDRYSTEVNDEPYQHIGDWPQVEPNSEVTFIQPLVNLSDKEISVDISYELYYWDSLRSEDLIDTKSETVKVDANGETDLSYVLSEVKEPVYYLKIKATNEGASSIVNIRVVSNVGKTRINYPAINNFPILKGEETTLFSCFHSIASVESGKLALTLVDKSNNIIAAGEYEGEIGPQMSAAALKFVSNKDYDNVKLRAELFNTQGDLVEEYNAVYNCSDIGGDKCRLLYGSKVKNFYNYFNIGLILLISLISILVVLRMNKFKNVSNYKKIILALVIFLIVIGTVFVANLIYSDVRVKEILAESISNQGKTKTESRAGSFWVKNDGRPVTTGTVTMTHTITLNPGTATPGGDSWETPLKDGWLKFNYSNSCSYNFNGGAWDTPYCGSVGTISDTGGQYGKIVVYGANPYVRAYSSNPAVITCSGLNCLVRGVGCSNITVKVDGSSNRPNVCIKTNTGVLCTSKNLSVGGLTQSRKERLLENGGASVGSYTTSAWKVCVADTNVGECGTADGSTNIFSNPTGTEACASGLLTNMSETTSGDTILYSWSCGSLSCNASGSSGGGSGGGGSGEGGVGEDEEVPLSIHDWVIFGLSPNTAPIVNEGEMCTIEWGIDTSSEGQCIITDSNGTVVDDSVTYPLDDPQERPRVEVDPQNEYLITCTDKTTDENPNPESVSSTVLRCILNPNIVEQ